MAITYGRHHITIGAFSDSKYIVNMLAKCTNAAERDHLVFLLSKLAQNKENVRELICAGALSILVDLAVLAHLHVNRAKLHGQVQSNLLEAAKGPESDAGTPEWYYTDKNGQRQGPISFGKVRFLLLRFIFTFNFTERNWNQFVVEGVKAK
ncbi:unnamed protein product [Anisakis simplex]|uniref:DnaJ homolog subfamily C member 13 (inferred by orthology to a human protein) n=1 Tax=Anisakis simplex TaxID=6269 RepID=A0A0M3JCI5_ANISI|nr:unnamed protein product [Anisakis simplex]